MFRSPSRLSALLLSGSLLAAGAALAQEGSAGEDVDENAEKVEQVVEERAAEENDQDGEANGADPGEASYNVANCAESNGEGGEGGSGQDASSGEDAAEDSDADGGSGEDAAVDPDVIEGCEDMIK